MNHRRFHAFSTRICALLLLTVVQSAAASIDTPAAVVDSAGQQQMLAQSLLKNYVLAALNVRSEKARQDLQADSAAFDAQLEALKSRIVEQKLQEKLLTIESLWTTLKPLYQQEPTRAAVSELQKKSAVLSAACQEFAALLAKQGGGKKLQPLYLIAQQRSLAQYLAAQYALKAWGVDDGYQKNVQQALTAADETMSSLNGESSNSTEIVAALVEVGKEFKRFGAVLTLQDEQYVPALVDRCASKISAKADQIVAMYEKLP